ncbi:MAG TPA: serine/threonine-protein kinase [Thermoanaerobaculia bacterium]|nr:serine/threonine-protein kinase [Thermoanaerobaculia bacterium]
MKCPDCGVELEDGSLVCPQCATQVATEPRTLRTPSPSNEPSAVPSLPGYDIESVLGEGGMGVVVLARERALDRRVAIKFMATREHDAGAVERFLREARVAATIEHPHVVRIYSYGESSGRPYIVMQYVEGETLARRIRRRGALPIDQALRITRQTAEALRAAWEKNVVHRDVKPSNILLDARGQAHVADFGLAKPLEAGDSSLTVSGSFVGTPYYISPEQAEGKSLDFRADLYSLGIILYEMLTGERPFDGSTPVAIVAKHLHEPFPEVRRLRSDLPREVEMLLASMTAKSPDARPYSHGALLKMLDDAARARALRSRYRFRAGAAAAVAICVLLAGAAFVFRATRPAPPAAEPRPTIAAIPASTVDVIEVAPTTTPLPSPPRLLWPADIGMVDPPNLNLDWALLRDAAAYRVQVAGDGAFQEIIADVRPGVPPAVIPVKGGRVYHWRVASIDSAGRQGEYSPSRRAVVTAAAPILLTPDGAVFRETVTLEWEPVPEAVAYVVRVDDGFERRTMDTRLKAAVTGGGVHRWQVASVDRRDIVGTFSRRRRFEIK